MKQYSLLAKLIVWGFFLLLISACATEEDEEAATLGEEPTGDAEESVEDDSSDEETENLTTSNFKKLEMSGDIGNYEENEDGAVIEDDPVHDPALIKAEDTYYVFSTGISRDGEDPGGIYVRKSEETLEGDWESIGEIPVPDWVHEFNWNEEEELPTHLWAPDVVEKEDTFYLYYAVSQFGTNNSAIGVASTSDPGDIESWEDHGIVTETSPEDDYNAIDPSVFQDKDGNWWMTFGSYWEGIQLQQLSEDMRSLENDRHWIADRNEPPNAIEAPNIFERDGYYYLFTSWDTCCEGTDSTYKIAAGRAESVEGPYEDEEGNELKGENDIAGGGTIILDSEDPQIGPGGQDVYEEDGEHYLIHHYYDGDDNGIIRMQIRKIGWTDKGWPIVSEEQ
ncbi:arabinan endo-1,5-alpha-L-arabinosidase [Salsuginibacillus kocurii]|uniref:arabinan endo-1,5-alpha-L-arabinosidase n=1 Tax=Salsuginibacillus kocurii TaxID=427078 RepID=UPI00036D2805|nr:arabinan endo-1,5-alpha-L-arabinosidase [Salsuginibacillus kocurii]